MGENHFRKRELKIEIKLSGNNGPSLTQLIEPVKADERQKSLVKQNWTSHDDNVEPKPKPPKRLCTEQIVK